MSFDNNKPLKLVDKNIINYYKQKIKEQEIIKNIKNEEIVIINPIKWYQCYLDTIKIFFKQYYGFILLFIIISILLFIRYNEVNKKKKKIKKMLKKINNNNNI